MNKRQRKKQIKNFCMSICQNVCLGSLLDADISWDMFKSQTICRTVQQFPPFTALSVQNIEKLFYKAFRLLSGKVHKKHIWKYKKPFLKANGWLDSFSKIVLELFVLRLNLEKHSKPEEKILAEFLNGCDIMLKGLGFDEEEQSVYRERYTRIIASLSERTMLSDEELFAVSDSLIEQNLEVYKELAS